MFSLFGGGTESFHGKFVISFVDGMLNLLVKEGSWYRKGPIYALFWTIGKEMNRRDFEGFESSQLAAKDTSKVLLAWLSYYRAEINYLLLDFVDSLSMSWVVFFGFSLFLVCLVYLLCARVVALFC